MQENLPPLFEWLIHLMEASVVIGIGATLYVIHKHPAKSKMGKQKNGSDSKSL